uniref:Ig-like domain-containing protein n=1 Tax=Oncorhynchus mykiss TaxID=8022 RepID=A0A8C7W2R8_ONCMY
YNPLFSLPLFSLFALNNPISNTPSLSQWNVWVPRDVSAMTNSCVVIYFTFMYPATPRHPRHLVLWQALLPALPVYGVQDIVRESYKGRTKLIGDVHQRNCTLLISNIGTDHSGGTTSVPTWASLYFLCPALTQKPSVLTPPLTEGEPATLTCTAPGICSGTPPNITWTWRGTGDNITELRDNTTTQRREDLTRVTTTHFSTLTFTPSAKHHGNKVTCLVTFNGGVTTKKTLKLNVTRKNKKYMHSITVEQILFTEYVVLKINCRLSYISIFTVKNIRLIVKSANAFHHIVMEVLSNPSKIQLLNNLICNIFLRRKERTPKNSDSKSPFTNLEMVACEDQQVPYQFLSLFSFTNIQLALTCQQEFTRQHEQVWDHQANKRLPTQLFM